jgi:mono/diheme cytochrome c family protein
MARRQPSALPGAALAALALVAVVLISAPTLARQPTAAALATVGQAIAERDCSSCHAIGRTGESPFEGAPRWRDLHTRFPVEGLAESLAEGITVGHEAMPVRVYGPADVDALIAYLKSLETPDPTGGP